MVISRVRYNNSTREYDTAIAIGRGVQYNNNTIEREYNTAIAIGHGAELRICHDQQSGNLLYDHVG